MTSDRPFDVILFGATGFTGRLAAEYLAHKGKEGALPEARPLRWAIAGRSAARLAEVKTALQAIDPALDALGVVEASAGDPASLARMARETRVVLSTVGPYAEHGEPLVEACIREGADYVDITGEPDFVDGLLERHDGAARARGVRIVNCCGFDSIPHDLGALFTVTKLPQGEPSVVEGFVRMKGSLSGGTWQSAINAMGNLRDRRRRPSAAPLSGGRQVHGLTSSVRYDKSLRAWVCPMPRPRRRRCSRLCRRGPPSRARSSIRRCSASRTGGVWKTASCSHDRGTSSGP